MNKFILFLKSTRCRKLLDILVFTVVGIPLFIFLLNELLYKGNEQVTNIFAKATMTIMLFIMGCAGFVAMIRKEFRQIIRIQGKSAQLMGLIIWITSWSILLLIWILIIFNH